MAYRERAILLLEQKLKSVNLRKHCLAVEAIMGELASHFGEPQENWKLSGLLHDVDYEETQDRIHLHSQMASEWLLGEGFPPAVAHAVLVHNQAHGVTAETQMERALIYADALSGLIVASALVLPSKKIADLKTENVLRRFKEKSFAKGVHREEILLCEKDRLTLEEFISLGIQALQKESEAIGL